MGILEELEKAMESTYEGQLDPDEQEDIYTQVAHEVGRIVDSMGHRTEFTEQDFAELDREHGALYAKVMGSATWWDLIKKGLEDKGITVSV